MLKKFIERRRRIKRLQALINELCNKKLDMSRLTSM